MEAMDAPDMFAEIVAPLAARAAEAAGTRTVDRDELAGEHIGDARADALHDAGGFRADDERHLALGESHAAPAPDVDMIERDRLDPQRHLARTGRLRLRQIGDFKLAVIEQLQGAHGLFLCICRCRARVARKG